METKKISIEFANYLMGYLYAKDPNLCELFKREIKRNDEIENESNKNKR